MPSARTCPASCSSSAASPTRPGSCSSRSRHGHPRSPARTRRSRSTLAFDGNFYALSDFLFRLRTSSRCRGELARGRPTLLRRDALVRRVAVRLPGARRRPLGERVPLRQAARYRRAAARGPTRRRSDSAPRRRMRPTLAPAPAAAPTERRRAPDGEAGRPLKAKKAKQKKIAIGRGVLLVASSRSRARRR